MSRLRLATRASPLALAQARLVAQGLRARWPGLTVSLVPIVSRGDQDRHLALDRAGTVGVFVIEIQQAVLAGRADAGVHSAKDLPTSLPPGLCLGAVLPRADPRDCLIGAEALPALPAQAVVGTSSPRRHSQLQRLRPDLRVVPLRGNVDTRLAKVQAGEVAATVLAAAGLGRLGLARRAHAVPLPIEVMVPAPAQGAIAVDCRQADRRTQRLLARLNHRDSARAIAIERAVLAGIGGGCAAPLGCLAWREHGRWRVRARLQRATQWAEADVTAAGAAAAIRQTLEHLHAG